MKSVLKQKHPLPDPRLQQVMEKYAVSVTDEMTDLMDADNAQDPVARQYLPSVEELTVTPEENADPIGDEAHAPVKGIVHRYPDRVLLKPVHVCAVYCRFCFRREKVGPGSEMLSDAELETALDYIRGNKEIWEVILTGGDPFVLSPRRLTDLMRKLNAIAHIKVIRFHTRVPAANPTRVNDDLAAALSSEKAVFVVVHCNHAREVTPLMKEAVGKLTRAGIPVLSQSVLLRGVNDTAEALDALFRALVEIRVKPYYLHHPDLAPGTSHFRLSIDDGRKIVRQLRGNLSGIAQPQYVLDIPGGFGKVPADDAWIAKENAASSESYRVTDYLGEKHVYPPQTDPFKE